MISTRAARTAEVRSQKCRVISWASTHERQRVEDLAGECRAVGAATIAPGSKHRLVRSGRKAVSSR